MITDRHVCLCGLACTVPNAWTAYRCQCGTTWLSSQNWLLRRYWREVEAKVERVNS